MKTFVQNYSAGKGRTVWVPSRWGSRVSEQNQRIQIVSIFSTLLFFLVEAAVTPFLISYFHFYSRIQENTNGQGPSFLLFIYFFSIFWPHRVLTTGLPDKFYLLGFFFKTSMISESLKLRKSSCAAQPIKYKESSDEHTAYNMWLCKFPK